MSCFKTKVSPAHIRYRWPSFGLDLAVIMALIILGTGLCTGDDVSRQNRYAYDSSQSVEGDGFVNSYSHLSTDYLNLRNAVHGSGSVSVESVIHSRQYTKYNISADGFSNTSDSEIKLDKITDATYSPTSFGIGRNSRTLSFASKWSDDTNIKNHGLGASMVGNIDHADSMSNDVSADIYSYSDYWKSDYWVNWDDYGNILRPLADSYIEESVQSAKLNVGSDFTGTARFYAVQSKDSPKNISVMLDESYQGTFSLTKKMELLEQVSRNANDEGWLPCCSGGWSQMDVHDKLGHGSSTERIFDCTCFRATASAQFQRPR
jgi:hypothetical protein